MKLTKKQKERNKQYLRKIKITNELNDLRFKDVNEVKCTRCKKKIEVKKVLDCRNKWLDAMNSNKKMGLTDSEFPFGVIPTLFQSSLPLLICKDCQFDVYRFLGKVPDLDRTSVFPHRYTPSLDLNKMFDKLHGKTPTIYTIHYKGKKYKDSTQKYNELVVKAVKAYIKKYPYIKYSEKQLIRILKNYKLQDSVTVY